MARGVEARLSLGWYGQAVRVLIADADQSFRELLKRLLGKAVDVVGEAGSAEEAVELAAQTPPDVVLMDIANTDSQPAGIAAIWKVKAARPDVKVIALTSHEDEAYLASTGKSGADAMLAKKDVRAEILSLVRTVMDANWRLWDGLERRGQILGDRLGWDGNERRLRYVWNRRLHR
jgi:DNA-binding NarL/FixJ family response regulator